MIRLIQRHSILYYVYESETQNTLKPPLDVGDR